MPSRPMLALVIAAIAAGSSAGQVKYPPRPEKYHVDLRYRIRADRDERIRQFRALTENLAKLGFVADPREDADLDVFDPNAERLSGTIPAANTARLFDDPRVRTILLVPEGTTLPDQPTKPVPVRIALRSGLEPTEQRLLHEQVVGLLGRMGFVQNVGYDHRGYSTVRGLLPAGRVPVLLKDLRDQPGGWFVAAEPRDRLPLPLRSVLPVQTVEVLPDVEGQTPPLPVTPVVGKLTPDLRAALADPAGQGKAIRVEAILDWELGGETLGFLARVKNLAPAATLEGVVGSIVTVRFAAGPDVERFAQLPEVTAVRLPRAAVSTLRPTAGGTPAAGAVLAPTRVADLHALGYRGDGVRVVVIGAEFPGLSGLIGKQLPQTTRFIDLTAELSPTIEPTPATATAATSGTDVALAVLAATPAAELTLIRVDPAAFHQLMTVARQASGEPAASVALLTRGREFNTESEDLVRRRAIVVDQYRVAFNDLAGTKEEYDAAVAELEQRKKAAQDRGNPPEVLADIKRAERELSESPYKRRADAAAAVEKLRADEAAFKVKFGRYVALRAALDGLTGTAVVVNTLVWEAGYPHDGLSALSRLLGERFVTLPTRTGIAEASRPPVPVWVQAGSDSVGSVWAGPFLDADGNGVMEFAAEGTKLAPGLWAPELNFLGTVAPDGKSAGDLPAGARLRFTLQWREPLPLDPAQPAPVFFPSLRLLRQIDPAGAKAASDEFAEVARSAGAAVRIQLNPASAVYEQTLEVTLPAAGRYALRVEGRTTAEGLLPALSRSIEVQPRVFVQSLGPGAAGRPVFTTFAPKTVGVGVPGDSLAAWTVGDGGGLTGTGPGVTLRAKPDVVLSGAGSSGIAAGYAGGIAASLVSAGARPTNLTRTFGLQPGGPLVLPGEWLQSLPRRP